MRRESMMWGHPISTTARVQERYRRPAFDTLEMVLTITDPTSNEEAFNKAIRDPAGGVVK